jgi:hypothetical protein
MLISYCRILLLFLDLVCSILFHLLEVLVVVHSYVFIADVYTTCLSLIGHLRVYKFVLQVGITRQSLLPQVLS